MEDEPIPPRIPKPDQLSIHHLNVQQIADAFDVEYYRKRTGSWNNYTMEGATKHMKYMLESVLKLFEDQFEEIESVGFRHQSKTIKDQILHQYIMAFLMDREDGPEKYEKAPTFVNGEFSEYSFGGVSVSLWQKKGGLTIEELVNHDGD
ncbi:hypothetical protein EYR41_011690 [Orbilia oligospora]|uniref:Uncharacterized protein n=1 Tax=Orbilia oligospora TaxID=2813651 RepID=A0A8H2DQK1_ORBOL|nr:hypothetical protein EYR41_011690 [Orbilia oligospora]